MHRIDENTYIDDSMVTCAEYQLFIDEMREQRKYYQPDHWTSYQFPEGNAREPILGVRQSDAVALGEWLTVREEGEWIYRLPTQQEAMNFPMKLITHFHLGFWLNEVHYFAWIGPVPKNARRIKHILAREFNVDPALVHDRAVERALSRAGIFEYYDYSDLDPNRADTIRREHADKEAKARNDARAYADIVTSDFNHTFTRELDSIHALDVDLLFTRARAFNLDLTFDRTHPLNHARALGLDLELAHPIAIDRVLSQSFDAFHIFVDLYTLRERIAGRSPALEGIRLVKERIK